MCSNDTVTAATRQAIWGCKKHQACLQSKLSVKSPDTAPILLHNASAPCCSHLSCVFKQNRLLISGGPPNSSVQGAGSAHGSGNWQGDLCQHPPPHPAFSIPGAPGATHRSHGGGVAWRADRHGLCHLHSNQPSTERDRLTGAAQARLRSIGCSTEVSHHMPRLFSDIYQCLLATAAEVACDAQIEWGKGRKRRVGRSGARMLLSTV